MGAWLAWQLWERIVRSSWTVTMPPGLMLELRPHDPVASGVLYCGLPDWPEMPFVLDYMAAGDTMVDVGANVGLYSLLAASTGGVNVVAFEPDPRAREAASLNVARNGLGGRVDVRAQAVGSVKGSGEFTVGLGPTNQLVSRGLTVSAERQFGAVRPVEVVTLDDTVPGPVAVLKVDVEGTEPAVLAGASQLLAKWRPALILEANDPAALTSFLAPMGYEWVDYDPDERRLRPAPSPPAVGKNGIAVANLDEAAMRVERPVGG